MPLSSKTNPKKITGTLLMNMAAGLPRLPVLPPPLRCSFQLSCGSDGEVARASSGRARWKRGDGQRVAPAPCCSVIWGIGIITRSIPLGSLSECTQTTPQKPYSNYPGPYIWTFFIPPTPPSFGFKSVIFRNTFQRICFGPS